MATYKGDMYDNEANDDIYDDEMHENMYAVPDRSMSNYYCDLCDAHMNSIQMWESHKIGKRHLKNMKKPERVPSKIRAMRCDDRPSYLMRLLEDVEDPIVGVKYICELQRVDPGVDPCYTCYLCQGTYNKLNIIEHLTSTKHRMAYLKLCDRSAHDMIENFKFGNVNTESLAEDKAAEWENKVGRGKVEVKLEKPKNVSSSAWYHEFQRHQKPETISSSKNWIKKKKPSSTSQNVSNEFCASSAESFPELTEQASSTLKGIQDMNILRDVGMLRLDLQLDMLKKMLVTNPISWTTKEDCKMYIKVVNCLRRCYISWTCQRMDLERKQKFVNAVLLQQEDDIYKEAFGKAKK